MDNKKPLILVVEDEPLLLQAILKKIRLSEFEAIGCNNGTEALANLKNNVIPQAIWLDYYLPDMDGLAFVKALKENEEWGKVPVVVVSNSASPDKVTAMQKLGVDNYLLKAEHRLDDIIDVISRVIGKNDTKK